MKRLQRLLLILTLSCSFTNIKAQDVQYAGITAGINFQSPLINVAGRKTTSLNGNWQAIIDPQDGGITEWRSLWKDKKPTGKADFYEYSFDGSTVLTVPGSFTSQLTKLNFYEGTVWYKKTFDYKKNAAKKMFLYFGAVNYVCDVFFNNEKIGSHEGGFTPFQFDITDKIKDGNNSVIVRTNNQRIKEGLPALGFDWFNYGGITRDVNLIETPITYISDYFIQLQKGNQAYIDGWVQLKDVKKSQQVNIKIPEANINFLAVTDTTGRALIHFPAQLILWSPENPKLYSVKINTETDSIEESIGFRTIEVKGTDILLNGKPVFLKGINLHEEIPQQKRRAYSEADAKQLLGWAKEMGCNFVRLAHYPHNEYMVRLAEKMGLMIWEEIPVYQGIAFADSNMQVKMSRMLLEMISRDKNRCGTIIWSMSNETGPGLARNNAIINMVALTKKLDPTRLISAAINQINYTGNTVSIDDTLCNYLDVIAVNEYLGWYKPWPSSPEEIVWKSSFNKPLIMSEFGAEALQGHHGSKDTASSWSEEYQEQVYKDQVKMFANISFLKGTCPWILTDFRSPARLNPRFQDGQTGMWNRKGLIGDKGLKKKAWYVMKEFYKNS